MAVRPKDIPEALWEAPSTLDLAAMPVSFREVVCRALIAERERCKKACDDEVERARQFGPHHIPIITSIRDAITKGEA
jgi:hypothetical protein